MARLRYLSNARTGAAGTVSKEPLRFGTSTAPLTTATTGLSLLKMYSDYSASGYHVPVWVVGRHTGDAATYGSVYCVRGDAQLEGTQTTQSNAQYIVGVHGRTRVASSSKVYNSACTFAGVMAQLLDGGTWTAANLVYCLWVDNQLTVNPTAGTVAMVGIRQNNNSANAVVDYVFDIQGNRIPTFINFVSCVSNGCITKGATHTATVTCDAKIKILIDGDTFYIPAYGGTITLD